MPRSIWNGTVSVGVVHVPVKLYSATESKAVHFHEEDKEVPFKEVVKGHEVASGEVSGRSSMSKDELVEALSGT